jgi:hypothetical protein
MHMLVQVNLELPGLQEALAGLLPKRVEIEALSFDQRQLRLRGRAPMVGAVSLTAKVKVIPGRMTLSSVDLQGAGLLKALVLSQLRSRLSELDLHSGSFRFWGDCDGSFAYLSWGA